MHVSLTPHWENFVHKKLEAGRYKNASEVFREALRLLEERDEMYQARLFQLRKDIEAGRSGEPLSFDADAIKQQGRKLREDRAH